MMNTNDDIADEIGDEPITEEQEREELLFRLKLLQLQSDIRPIYNKNMSLVRLKQVYGVAINLYRREKGNKEAASLRLILANIFKIVLDVKDIDGNDKIYTLEELNKILDDRLKELSITRDQLVGMVDIMAGVILVSGIHSRV